MQIQISSQSKSKLLTFKSQTFLIVNLIGSFFVLTKASHKESFNRNINFQFDGQQFYSTFARHLNLPYARKLSQLVEILNIQMSTEFQNQWLMFYQIHNFSTEKMKRYQIKVPPYGAQIHINSRDGVTTTSIISNSFRHHGQTFYFLSVNPSSCQQFSIITDQKSNIVYGITYFLKDVVVCVPFHIICSQKSCPLHILPQIRPLLEGTCYIRYIGNYCTGFILNKNLVITARHLLPSQNLSKGKEVGVRFYPYNQQKVGFINRVGHGNVDLLQILIVTKNMIKQTPKLRTQQKMIQESKMSQILGKQIIALGFGKYGYSPKVFSLIDIVMPTVQVGVVSKIIQIKEQTVFVKTDAALYNGFSGCGIWLGNRIIGMAVFILKNKNTNSNFNRHNFSYFFNFIVKVLDFSNNQDPLTSQINQQLAKFDKIQTRFKIPIEPRL